MRAAILNSLKVPVFAGLNAPMKSFVCGVAVVAKVTLTMPLFL